MFFFREIKKLKFIKKYIYISTPEIFGNKNKSIDEYSLNFNPSTPYAVSKLTTELMFKTYCSFFKFPICIARFSNFYGPGQELNRLIPKMITSIDNKIKFPIEGSGNSIRDFIYTEDFCNGIYRVIKKGKIGRIYHFSTGKFYKIKEIINIICKLKNVNFKSSVKKIKDRIGKDKIYKLSCKKTINELGWKTNYSLIKGIKLIINYHNKYKNRLNN